MDPLERIGDPDEQQRLLFNDRQAAMWTAMPGILQSFNPTKYTCTVQPAIKGTAIDKQGGITHPSMPTLQDVPVVFPRSKNYVLTFPLAAGDEGLIVFSARCIDNWWALGGQQQPFEPRMHDLSDALFIPGPYSQPQLPAIANTDAVELRHADGDAWIQMNGKDINVKTPTQFTVSIGSDMQFVINEGEVAVAIGGACVWRASASHVWNNQSTSTAPMKAPGFDEVFVPPETVDPPANPVSLP